MFLLYALSAWDGYISIDNVGRLNKILRKAKRYVFTASLLTFSKLWEQSDEHWRRSLWQGGQLPAHFLLPMGKPWCLPYHFLPQWNLKKRAFLHPLVQCYSLFILSYFVGQMSTKHGYVNYIIAADCHLSFCRATWNADENSVRLSVVHQMCGYCDKREEKSVQICVPYETSFSLVFSEEKNGWCGATPSTEILGQPAPVGAKWPILNRYPLIAPQP